MCGHAAAEIIAALQAADVQFMSCHTATEERARILVQRKKLSQSRSRHIQECPRLLLSMQSARKQRLRIAEYMRVAKIANLARICRTANF